MGGSVIYSPKRPCAPAGCGRLFQSTPQDEALRPVPSRRGKLQNDGARQGVPARSPSKASPPPGRKARRSSTCGPASMAATPSHRSPTRSTEAAAAPTRSRSATRKARPGRTVASSRAVSPSSGACAPVFVPNYGMPPARLRAEIQASSCQAGIHPRLQPVRATCL